MLRAGHKHQLTAQGSRGEREERDGPDDGHVEELREEEGRDGAAGHVVEQEGEDRQPDDGRLVGLTQERAHEDVVGAHRVLAVVAAGGRARVSLEPARAAAERTRGRTC